MSSKSEKRPLGQWDHRTVKALAEALGVHRNWISELLGRGAPGGPPFCELAWRAWMAGNGHEVKKPPAQRELLVTLANMGSPIYRKWLNGEREATAEEQAATGQRQVAVTQTAVTFGEREAKADAESAEYRAEQERIDLGVRKGTIIGQDPLHLLVDAIGRLWEPLMHKVPDACLDAANRAAVEACILANQQLLESSIEAELKKFLEELVTSER